MTQKNKALKLYKDIRDNQHPMSEVVKLGRIDSVSLDCIDTRQFMEVAKFSGIQTTNAERYLRKFKATDKAHKEQVGTWYYQN